MRHEQTTTKRVIVHDELVLTEKEHKEILRAFGQFLPDGQKHVIERIDITTKANHGGSLKVRVE